MLVILEIGVFSICLSVEGEQLTGIQIWRLVSCLPIKLKKSREARFSPFKLGMHKESWEVGGGSDGSKIMCRGGPGHFSVGKEEAQVPGLFRSLYLGRDWWEGKQSRGMGYKTNKRKTQEEGDALQWGMCEQSVKKRQKEAMQPTKESWQRWLHENSPKSKVVALEPWGYKNVLSSFLYYSELIKIYTICIKMN